MDWLTAIEHSPLTRRHAIKLFVATAGAAVLPSRATAADPPWGEALAPLLATHGTPLKLGDLARFGMPRRAAEPAIAFDPTSRRIWTCWTEPSEGRDAVLLRSFNISDATWGEAIVLSARGDDVVAAYDTDLVVAGSGLLVVWAQRERDGWAIYSRRIDLATSALGDVERLAHGAGLHAHPTIAAAGDHALAAWQVEDPASRQYKIRRQLLDARGTPMGDQLSFSAPAGHDLAWPALASDGRRFALAMDSDDGGGTSNIVVTLLDDQGGNADEPLPASNHPARNFAPAAAFSPDGTWLWVAWHTDRHGEDGWDIPRWYRLAGLRLADMTWHVPTGATFEAPESARGTVQGFELVRVVVSPAGVVTVLGRASHNFYVQYFASNGPSPVYRLPDDGWGGRGRLLRGVFDNGGALWLARRDLNTNVLQRVGGFDGLAGPPPVTLWEEPARPTRPALKRVTPRYEWPAPGPAAKGLQLMLGDLHGHSWQSDGMGDPRENFLRARDYFRDDFHALTDHDEFIAKRISDGQWEEQKALVEHYHQPERFITLFAQEWTTPRTTAPNGWGHANLYSADPAMPLLPHTEERYRDLPGVYEVLRRHGGIAIPHHIGWTGVKWDALDPELTPLIEVVSAHGAYEHVGNEPIPHRGEMQGCFLRDGLAGGRRIGVVGGSDQHGLVWHHGAGWKRDVYRAGLTGVWARELSRAGLLEALRQRRTFATSGVKLSLYFTVNGELMGGVAQSAGPAEIEVDVAIPPEEGKLAWLQVIRNGQIIRRVGSEGPRTKLSFRDDAAPAGVSWYYARLVLASGDQAWSSAVWVG